jgi:hypothetical protein
VRVRVSPSAPTKILSQQGGIPKLAFYRQIVV